MRDAFADTSPANTEPSNPSADACSTHPKPNIEPNPANFCSYSSAYEVANERTDTSANAADSCPYSGTSV